jgi:hypothetical protein
MWAINFTNALNDICEWEVMRRKKIGRRESER